MLLIATLLTAPAPAAEVDLPQTVQTASKGKVTADQVRKGLDTVRATSGRTSIASMIDAIDGNNRGRPKNFVQRWLRGLRERAGGMTIDTVVSAIDGRPGIS